MLTPDYRTFLQLSRDATLIPVTRTISSDLLTGVSAFLSIAQRQKYAFLLESVEGGEKIGRYTFLGADPRTVITARGRDVTIREGSSVRTEQANVLEVLRRHLRQHRPAQIPGLPPFTSGGVGYFAYDMVRQFERVPERTEKDVDLPDCIFTFYDRLLAFDRLRHQIHIIAAADVRSESPRKAYDRAITDIAAIEHQLARGIRGQHFHWSSEGKTKSIRIHTSTSHDDFVSSVRRAKKYIAAGDIFQVVLSQRLDFKAPAEPFQIYRALRAVNPSPYMFFLKLDDTHVLGASPEMLVRVAGRKLDYRPIAGTHKRGADAAEDDRLIEHLRNDEKERAEHVMLVDLGRNDLGRVSEYGSVKVRDLMYVEKYSHVMHLVSALEGKLRGRSRRPRCARCMFSRRHAQRRSQSSRHGDHRRVGAGAPRRLWRGGALCRSCGQSRFLHRHPHHGSARRPGVRASRRGHRRRLRSREGIPGVHEQGQRALERVRKGEGIESVSSFKLRAIVCTNQTKTIGTRESPSGSSVGWAGLPSPSPAYG